MSDFMNWKVTPYGSDPNPPSLEPKKEPGISGVGSFSNRQWKVEPYTPPVQTEPQLPVETQQETLPSVNEPVAEVLPTFQPINEAEPSLSMDSIMGTEQTQDYGEYTEPVPYEGPTLEDLQTNPEMFKVVQDYMIERMGVDYAPGGKNSDPAQVIEDFMDHMRYTEANVVSAYNEWSSTRKATPYGKIKFAEAYDLYDKLGFAWQTDENTAGWVTDYAEALLMDPTNIISLGTAAFLKKAGAGAGMAGIRELTKLEAKNLIKKGAVVEGTEQSTKASAEALASSAVNRVFGKGGASLGKRAAITGAVDTGFAVFGDIAYQKARMEVGQQEDFNWVQAGVVAALGATGAGLPVVLDAIPTRSKKLTRDTMLTGMLAKPKKEVISKKIAESFKQFVVNYDWEELVAQGRQMLQTDSRGTVTGVDPKVFEEFMFGTDKVPGFVDTVTDSWMLLDDTKGFTHNLVSFLKDLPKDSKQELNMVLKAATGFDVDQFATAVAASTKDSAQILNIESRASRIIGQGAKDATELFEAEKAMKRFIDAGLENTLGYAANSYRRLLVSAFQTTAANVQGSLTYIAGEGIADLFAMPIYTAVDVANRDWTFKRAKAYGNSLRRKAIAFIDPSLARETFEALVSMKPEQMSALRDMTAFGISDPRSTAQTMKRYKLDTLPGAWQKVIKVGEGGIDFFQTIAFVRQQDSYFKSIAFNDNLALLMELKTGKSIEQHILDGTFRENLTHELVGEAVHRASRTVFSADYGVYNKNVPQNLPLLGNVPARMVNMFEQLSNLPGVGFVIPFPRFMVNVVANTIEWTPAGVIGPSLEAGQKILKGKGHEISLGRGGPVAAFSKAAVGTAAVLAIADALGDQTEIDPLFTLDTGSGERRNIQNMFPASFAYLSGFMLNQYRQNGFIDETLWDEWAKQLAFGQLTSDVADATNVLAAGFAAALGRSSSEGLGTLGGFVGGIVGGASRPLTQLDTAIGIFEGNNLERNRRHPVGWDQAFKENAARYTENIFNTAIKGLGGTVEPRREIDNRERASRPEGSFIEDPVGRMLTGAPATAPKSFAERAAAMAGFPNWKIDFSDKGKDREMEWFGNRYVGPVLDAQAEKLLNSKNYINGDRETRYKMFDEMLARVRREVITEYLGSGREGPTSMTAYMRSRIKQVKEKSPNDYRWALKQLADNYSGWIYDGDINAVDLNELNYDELKVLNELMSKKPDVY